MTVTFVFKDINWSDYAHDEIKIIKNYSSSNDYEGTDIEVNGKYMGGDITTPAAVREVFGEVLGAWLLNHVRAGKLVEGIK